MPAIRGRYATIVALIFLNALNKFNFCRLCNLIPANLYSPFLSVRHSLISAPIGQPAGSPRPRGGHRGDSPAAAGSHPDRHLLLGRPIRALGTTQPLDCEILLEGRGGRREIGWGGES